MKSTLRFLPIIILISCISGCGDDDGYGKKSNNDSDPTPDESRIRLINVDPAQDQFSIRNFTSREVDISNYWICSLFQYEELSELTIVSGNLNLGSGETVVLSGWELDDEASDVGLYVVNNFNSTTALMDFMQYGDSGLGREGVADGRGIWTAGDAITGSGPFNYSGNGSQDGIGFWD